MARQGFFDKDDAADGTRTSDEAPVTGRAVAVSRRRADWCDWSQEQERKRRQADADQQRAFAETAVYTLEIARKVAADHVTTCPDWHYLRDDIGSAFARILRNQPEMRQHDVAKREQIIVALFNALPRHLHGALSELRQLLELVQIAHEATAFVIGVEFGKRMARAFGTTCEDGVVLGAPPEPGGSTRSRTAPSRKSQAPTSAVEVTVEPPLVSLPTTPITLKAIQKAAIVAALDAEHWSQARAAERLQMQGGALNQWMKRLRIEYPPEHAHKRRPRQTRALARVRAR